MNVTTRKAGSFVSYVDRKIGMENFQKLSYKRKDEVFLRWKHGFCEASSNEAVESTERAILCRVDRALTAKMTDERKRKYWSAALDWQEYCDKVKKQYVDKPQEDRDPPEMYNKNQPGQRQRWWDE